MSDTKPFFSIIIPVYNVEQYLVQCLDSVFKQNFESKEVICVNDGSPDNSGNILVDYKKGYPQLRIIDRPNGGLSAARNTGLINSTGEYIILLDSDDVLAENCMQRLYEEARQKKPDIIIANTISYGINGNIIDAKRLASEIIPQSVDGISAFIKINASDNYLPMAYNLVCKRTFLLKHNLYFEEGIVFEDELWTPQTILKADHVTGFQYYHYYYYQRNKSIINSSFSKLKIRSLETVIQKLILFEKSFNISNNPDIKGWLLTRAYLLNSILKDKTKISGESFNYTKELKIINLFEAHLNLFFFNNCLQYLVSIKWRRRLLRAIYKIIFLPFYSISK